MFDQFMLWLIPQNPMSTICSQISTLYAIFFLWQKTQLRFCGIWFWLHTLQKSCLFAVQQNNNNNTVSFIFHSRIDLQKMSVGKLRFLIQHFSEMKSNPAKENFEQSNVSQVKQSPHANLQLFWALSKLVKKSRESSSLWPFNLLMDIVITSALMNKLKFHWFVPDIWSARSENVGIYCFSSVILLFFIVLVAPVSANAL